MRAPVSVVIPTLNAASALGPCLGALGEALTDGILHEVILADGGSSDGIGDIAEATGARLVQSAPGRGAQMAEGARSAKALWVLFLHADSVLQPGWAQALHRHIAAHPDQAGYFRLRFASGGLMARLTAGWANVRARMFGLPFGDQGLLAPRALIEQVGGVPEIALMEDIALARLLRGKLRAIDATVETSAERYLRNGWLRQGIGNLWRQARYLAGTPAEVLARTYRR